VSHFVSCVKSA